MGAFGRLRLESIDSGKENLHALHLNAHQTRHGVVTELMHRHHYRKNKYVNQIIHFASGTTIDQHPKTNRRWFSKQNKKENHKSDATTSSSSLR